MSGERLERGARQVNPLVVGDHVYVQEQHGISPKLWKESGTVVEILGHNGFLIKLES